MACLGQFSRRFKGIDGGTGWAQLALEIALHTVRISANRARKPGQFRNDGGGQVALPAARKQPAGPPGQKLTEASMPNVRGMLKLP